MCVSCHTTIEQPSHNSVTVATQVELAIMKVELCKIRDCASLFSSFFDTANIFCGFMVSLYGKGKENGHTQAYAPNEAMGLK